MFKKRFRIKSSVAGVLAVALVAVLVAAPVAFAKSHSVKLNLTAPVNAKTAKIKGSGGGKPFGKCSVSGKIVLPKAFITLKCKGGKVNFTTSSKSKARNNIVGTWKVTGGSGKYKRIKGSGKLTGKFSNSKFVYTGTVKY